MNISKPDTTSKVYKQFIGLLNQKVSTAVVWLNCHHIEYSWNNWIGGHLYRLYIPCKDLLLDFEYYPVNNIEYNYIRINFDTDIEQLLGHVFPDRVYNTEDLKVWKLVRLGSNKFLRGNGASPVYDNKTLRLAWVDGTEILQCMILKGNKIITNVTRNNCSVFWGTYMMLRYFNESFGVDEILIKECMDSSYTAAMYQLLHLPIVAQTKKKKIWWSPEGTKWHIKREDTDKYIPFYFCETVTYRYPG